MKFSYTPQGVCAKKIDLEIEDGIIVDVAFTGGCNGNTSGICRLVKGAKIDDVIDRLKGTICGVKKTSCPDQLAKALEAAKKQVEAEA